MECFAPHDSVYRLCVLFFFTASDSPRNSPVLTHSFPTRRSSDLRGLTMRATRVGMATGARAGACGAGGAAVAIQTQRTVRRKAGYVDQVDRKSTRLNSSH